MPPMPTISRDNVLNAAVTIVRNKGFDRVNARNLAEILNCSTKPLFRIYKNMEELKTDIFFFINEYFSKYIYENNGLEHGYLGLAMTYINFARVEPRLFKTIFMNNHITGDSIKNMLSDRDIGKLLMDMSVAAQISLEDARAVYQKMWLLSHGIASLVSSNSNTFETNEVNQLLSDALNGFVLQIKNRGHNNDEPI